MYEWNRQFIKEYAKDFLRKHYWKAFLVCLIVALLTGGNGHQVKVQNRPYEEHRIEISENKIPMRIENSIVSIVGNNFLKSPVFYMSKGILIGFGILAIIFAITVGDVLVVGQARFFLNGFKEDVNVKYLFSTFNLKEYISIVKTQFIKSFYNLLWFLLLIIPGIVKAYEYSMVTYILAEDPLMPANEAISKSREITNGHKMDMFILDLSFIGWYILGSLLLGLGGFFVNPYREATWAKLYNTISGNDFIDDTSILE